MEGTESIEAPASDGGAPEYHDDISAAVEEAWDTIESDDSYEPDADDLEARDYKDPADITEKDLQPDPEGVAKVDPEGATIEAPTSWATDAKDVFAGLPPDAQKIIADRESQREANLTQRQQEFSAGLKEIDGIRQVVAPYSQTWRNEGIRPSEVIKEWLDFGSRMDADPVAGLRWLADQYDLMPPTISGGQQQTNGYTGGHQNPVYDQRIAQAGKHFSRLSTAGRSPANATARRRNQGV